MTGSPHGHAQLLRLEEGEELLPGPVYHLPVQGFQERVPDTQRPDAGLLRRLVQPTV